MRRKRQICAEAFQIDYVATLEIREPNIPLLKSRLHIVTSFLRVHMVGNFIVGKFDKQYFSQVIKVNINVHKSC